MSNTNVVGYALAGRYTGALIDTVVPENKLEQTYQDILKLRTLFKTGAGIKLLKALKSPDIPAVSKKKMIDESLKSLSLSQYVINTLFLMVDKHREFAIGYFVKSFRDKYNTLKNILFVEIESPFELEDSMKTRIEQYLKRTTKRDITMLVKIDPKLVGGLRIICGEKTIDSTIERNFELLKKSFNLIS